MSIVQGGPGLPGLARHVYEYISTGQYPQEISDGDVPNAQVQLLIARVCADVC